MFGFFVLLSSQCFALPTIVTEEVEVATTDALALNVIHSRFQEGVKGFFIGFAVEVAPPRAGLAPQQLLVDSGSGMLAFCDKQVIEKASASPLRYPEKSVLQMFLHPESFKAADPPMEACVGGNVTWANLYGKGNEFGFGIVYASDLYLGAHHQNKKVLSNVVYGVMDGHSPGVGICETFEGIFGVQAGGFIGGPAGNVMLPNATSSVSHAVCIAAEGVPRPPTSSAFTRICEDFSNTIKQENWCGMHSAMYETVLQTGLAEEDARLFGIHLNVGADDWQSLYEVDGIKKNMGTAYLGKEAVAFRNLPEAQTALSGKGLLADTLDGNWNVQVNSVTVTSTIEDSSVSFNISEMGVCVSEGKTVRGSCFVDSGTPEFIVPDFVYAAVTNASDGDLQINLEGPDGEECILHIPIKPLVEMIQLNNATTSTGTFMSSEPMAHRPVFIFGFVFWLFYDTIFDYGNDIPTPFKSVPSGNPLYGLPSTLFKEGQEITFIKK